MKPMTPFPRFRHLCLYGLILAWLSWGARLYAASVTVSWEANSETDLAGYTIYYGTSSRDYAHKVVVGNQTSYRVTGLKAGTRYYFAVTAFDFSGNESAFSEEVSVNIPEDAADDAAPATGALAARAYNFPNPFKAGREATTIRYELSEEAPVTVEILDVGSRLVRRVVAGDLKAAGEHTEDRWDGRAEDGDLVATGIYLCRIRAGGSEKIVKIAVVREN